MDITDPEQEEVATAKDRQPENSNAVSYLLPAEQNGSESLASSKDEEVDEPHSECPDSSTPQSSPASCPQLSPTRRETPLETSLGKKEVSTSSLILHA